jgi:Ecdysteroid kinase-like family
MPGMTAVPPQASTNHLTTVLRRAGVLGRGEVVDVAVETSRDTLISRIMRLRLTYDGADSESPTHVFFKTSHEGVEATIRELGRKEVAFYDVVASITPPGLLPRYYGGLAEPERPWHLILEDLTASHAALGDWPVPPPLEKWYAIVVAHARFHAFWWDHERLGVSVGAFADDAGQLERNLAAFPKEVATFADRLGDRLSADRKRIYERLIAATPRLAGRYRTHRNMTIIHGDAHVWNALLPRDHSVNDVRLIDWDAWRIGTATGDLAYMIAVHWFPDWRRRYERDSLLRYHDALLAGGVRGYSFDALWEDYRHSVLWNIATPMWQANHGLGPWIWWHHLDRIMSAVHDLGCLDLLD